MESQPLDFRSLPEAEMKARAAAFYESMKVRRTIRDFSDRPVSREIIETALLTAGTAPNGANLQPWHFAVVQNPAIKTKIRLAAEAEEKEFYQHKAPPAWLAALAPLGTDADKPFIEKAPWLIAVFSQGTYADAAGASHVTYYAKESTGIAGGFLIAALHQAGLATLTHTPSPMNFLNGILGRPAQEKPFLLIVTGYPADGATVPVFAAKKKPLSAITSWH